MTYQGYNPYRTDPFACPFEQFWIKFHMTPQCIAVPVGESTDLLYTKGYEVKSIDDIPAGKVALVFDELTHRYEFHDRELFMRADQQFDPTKLATG